jgi:hypothetical protein
MMEHTHTHTSPPLAHELFLYHFLTQASALAIWSSNLQQRDGGTKRDDARNQARLLISELNDQSYHDSVQVPLATDGKKKLGKAILYKNTVFNPKVTSCSMHEMDLLVYQEAFLTQCPKDLCSAVREFLDLMGTHSRETSLANVRPGLHTNASSPEDSIAVAHKTFALRERQLTSLPINDLVHPSGTLKDRLGVLLHWPTQVTTSEPLEQNETADPGGPCPQLLMRKGVPVDGVLWLDTFARRVEHLKKEGSQPKPFANGPMA